MRFHLKNSITKYLIHKTFESNFQINIIWLAGIDVYNIIMFWTE